MARPLRIEYPGAFYHVTARGNEQKDIFKSRRDREQFLSYLESAAVRYGAVIHAYCLMSNHYHLLLETPTGNLSQIMRHINGAYTTYFNIKRKRAGHLFQGRYKAILVEADSYATELSRYIHLNPVRVGMVVTPEEYEWSSYRDYIGERNAVEWVKNYFILGYFGKKAEDARKKYRLFVNDLLNRDYESPLMATVASSILGDADFIQEITESHLSDKEVDRNLPSLRELSKGVLIEKILAGTPAVISNDNLARQAKLYLCHRYSGATLKEIGVRFGMGESGVSQASRRFAMRIKDDAKLRKLIEKVESRMRLS